MASKDYPIAVIGISCFLPKNENCSEFWQFILEKQESNGNLSAHRAKDIDHIVKQIKEDMFVYPNSPFYTGSHYERIDQFDANFFGISPQEAAVIDPQQRFFLRTAWEAFEDAGLAADIWGSQTGVYIGNPVYNFLQVHEEPSLNALMGSQVSFTAARVAYTFDLRGPAFVVNTACSSSLLATHVACQGLKDGDCKVAIAGGVCIDCLPIYTKNSIWHMSGFVDLNAQCRPFDDKADFMTIGEGSAAVVLKPLDEAIKDGNHIYGVLLSSYTNQSGRTNGLSTPHPRGQSDLLVSAWKKAGVDPEKVQYFEAHGSGTKFGDSIEIYGIQMAFERLNIKPKSNEAEKPCIGSVKANIGDLGEGVAGVISLVKVLLALHNEKIPPQANFATPNKDIDWKKSPFRVTTEPIDWKQEDGRPRIASVNSLGDANTSVHVVVQDYKMPSEESNEDNTEHLQPILLSALNQKSLLQFVMKLVNYVSELGARKSNFEKVTRDGFTCFIVEENTNDSDNSNDQTSENSIFYSIYSAIMNQDSIPWQLVYKKRLPIVPQLPTYAFDEQRYWPTIPSKKGVSQ
ncbi:hypothetical protein B4U79_08401 [Dinothrombium tinctorium]|uniref:Ketosynthase family 3 (KS3) domain-containing protein n=1 Tax=Dinothrombium tinctorium TaxID=1965070 RepID=A0A443R6Q0_9ACAR|nr:hypothetical protein B4U79_08401 [Dinothrombium tinctorium]